MNALPYWLALLIGGFVVLMIPTGEGLLVGITIFIVLALIFQRIYEEYIDDH